MIVLLSITMYYILEVIYNMTNKRTYTVSLKLSEREYDLLQQMIEQYVHLSTQSDVIRYALYTLSEVTKQEK